jgi:hypothetical protein
LSYPTQLPHKPLAFQVVRRHTAEPAAGTDYRASMSSVSGKRRSGSMNLLGRIWQRLRPVADQGGQLVVAIANR